jgi:hypothetical protein
LKEELRFSGNLAGTVLSWSNISWTLSNVTKGENISEMIFCKTPSKRNVFIFSELRTPKQGENLCASYGTQLFFTYCNDISNAISKLIIQAELLLYQKMQLRVYY